MLSFAGTNKYHFGFNDERQVSRSGVERSFKKIDEKRSESGKRLLKKKKDE